jgi:group II intron reverse transcriptase/maturase
MSTKLMSLTLRARENPRGKFTSLAHLLNEEFLLECFKEIKRGKSPGIDGKTVEEYEDNLEGNIKNLIQRMKVKRYRPQPVKRVCIPEPDGSKRPSGIPTVEDRIVQMGIKKILEAIFEVDFVDVSYGFRPDRSCHNALAELNEIIMTEPVNYMVDMDIEKFFDTVDHCWLMECLRQRISDPNLLQLIDRFLNTGVIEEGKYLEIDRGTPQGGVLSPLLANIYLHYILDLWFEKVVKKQLVGYAKLIRYADDFIVCFQNDSEARKFSEMLKERFSKFGLKIAENKSRIIEFGRYAWYKAQRREKKLATFDFPGITHYCGKSREGKFRLGRETARKKYWQKIREMNRWLKDIRNSVELKLWWSKLEQKLRGHYQYYGIGGNMRAIGSFYHRTVKFACKWINRRSQKRSFNWTQFNNYLLYSLCS